MIRFEVANPAPEYRPASAGPAWLAVTAARPRTAGRPKSRTAPLVRCAPPRSQESRNPGIRVRGTRFADARITPCWLTTPPNRTRGKSCRVHDHRAHFGGSEHVVWDEYPQARVLIVRCDAPRWPAAHRARGSEGTQVCGSTPGCRGVPPFHSAIAPRRPAPAGRRRGQVRRSRLSRRATSGQRWCRPGAGPRRQD